MTVVDVNTGKFTGSGGNLEETVTKNNLEAAEEIVRQLRLRDIGGIIVVDFIDMVLESNRDLVLRRLVECLGRDRTRHQVAEVTSLGLVQMTRKRIGTGLLEAFSENCEHCQGRGVVIQDAPVEPTAAPTTTSRAVAAAGAAGAGGRGDAQPQRHGRGQANGGPGRPPKDIAAMAAARGPPSSAADPAPRTRRRTAEPEPADGGCRPSAEPPVEAAAVPDARAAPERRRPPRSRRRSPRRAGRGAAGRGAPSSRRARSPSRSRRSRRPPPRVVTGPAGARAGRRAGPTGAARRSPVAAGSPAPSRRAGPRTARAARRAGTRSRGPPRRRRRSRPVEPPTGRHRRPGRTRDGRAR